MIPYGSIQRLRKANNSSLQPSHAVHSWSPGVPWRARHLAVYKTGFVTLAIENRDSDDPANSQAKSTQTSAQTFLRVSALSRLGACLFKRENNQWQRISGSPVETCGCRPPRQFAYECERSHDGRETTACQRRKHDPKRVFPSTNRSASTANSKNRSSVTSTRALTYGFLGMGVPFRS